MQPPQPAGSMPSRGFRLAWSAFGRITRKSQKSVFCRGRFVPRLQPTHWHNASSINSLPTAPIVQLRSTYRLRLKEPIFSGECGNEIACIPAGSTATYGELARRLKAEARAVGQACGDNRLPLAIPCHRVVAASGIGGFAHHRGGAYEAHQALAAVARSRQRISFDVSTPIHRALRRTLEVS